MTFLIKLLVLTFVPTLLFAAGSSLKAVKTGVTIGFISGANPETFESQGLELAKDLQKKLGSPVNIYIAKSYDGLIKAMEKESIDFAFFSPSVFVQAESKVPVKVLLKKVWQEPFYYSALIVPSQSKVKELKDLKHQRIAYVDKKSASGYLYPSVAFKKINIQESDFEKVVYTGNHEESVKLLLSGGVDAAAVFSDDEKGLKSAWQTFAPNDFSKFKILWLSEPIPNDAFCVRQKFYDKNPKLVHEMMFALVDLVESGDEGEKTKYSDLIGSKSLMPATSKQYDVVREMLKTIQ